jgi:hypothetical protein
MLAITYIAAIFAAMMNASSAVAQRLATKKPDAKRLFSSRFVYEIFKSRLFLFGLLLQTLAALAQAVALKNGGLIIVEPLLTSDLIFLLLIMHFKLNIQIKPRDWLAAVAVMVGLAGLFLAANPKGGHLRYQAYPWILLLAVVVPLIIFLIIIIRKLKSANLRAMLAGIAAATAFAMNAALVKLSFNLFDHHGLAALMASWPVYAFIVSGIISLYLMVNAYGAGPLAISQPVMEVSEPAIAITIGIMIFGDSYDSSITAIAIGMGFVVILIVGIILLGSSPRIQQAGERGI